MTEIILRDILDKDNFSFSNREVLVAEIKDICYNNPLCGIVPNCPIYKFVTESRKAVSNYKSQETDFFAIADESGLVKQDDLIVGLDGYLGTTFKCHGPDGLDKSGKGEVIIARKKLIDCEICQPKSNEDI